jgi:chromosome segregation ATPase
MSELPVGTLRALLNERDSLERQIENCRNTNPMLSEELDRIESEINELEKQAKEE